jgi:polyisoprenoid-binding protein YceI
MNIHIKYGFAVLFGILVGGTGAAQTKWNLDNSHTNIKFTVTHLVISEVEGSFKTFSGSMTASKPDFTDAQIEFTVSVASITTDNEMRDGQLKSDDFFNAEKFPNITFRSISMKKTGENKYELTGTLTIRDITRRVTFDVIYGGTVKDPWGNIKAGFKATGTINRFDYNLKWNTLTEGGGAVVGPDVRMTVNAEFSKEK